MSNTLPLPFFNKNLQPLFKFWDQLSPSEQTHLIHQIKRIDLSLLQQQQALLSSPSPHYNETLAPFLNFSQAGNELDLNEGRQRIQQGQMGCLILAGGQGSRLRFKGPKGLYPVSIIKHKSLFQLFMEKTLAASKQIDRPLQIAIMTSPQNDLETKNFFHLHRFFGLNPESVSFFSQRELPLLDKNGHLFLESPSQVAFGPNGNGFSLHDFIESGIAAKWSEQGIQFVNVILIDNPLADPFDAELLGFHCRQSVDVTLKCTEKREAEEKVGVVVQQQGRCRVIEYSEIAEEEKQALAADGRLKHRCANLSLFCFSMNFIFYLHKQKKLPLHAVWRATKFVDEQGTIHQAIQPNAWKFETFIFDLLQFTERVAALLYPREQCFAPLKNLAGPDSLETVQAALQKRDCQIIERITGLLPSQFPFELAADFYYPVPSLLAKWKGKSISKGYIAP